MKRHLPYVLLVMLGLLAFTPGLYAQAVAVSSHITIVPGLGTLFECSTEADYLTSAAYSGVSADCAFYSGNILMGRGSSIAPALASSGEYISPYRGVPNVTYGSHGLRMYPSYVFAGPSGAPCDPAESWYDPYRYGLTAGITLPDYTETQIIPGGRGLYTCWAHYSSDPADGFILGLATTHSNPVTLMAITPSNKTLFAGDEVTLTTNKPATWTLNGIGELKNTTPTSTVYKAAASIPFDQVAFVKACATSNPNDCDEAGMNLVQVTVSVFPDNQELVQGETLPFSATIIPNSFDPTNAVTWSASAGTFNGNVYAAPQNSQIPAGGTTVTVTAKSTKNPNITGTATVYLAHVNRVDVVATRSAMVADPSQTTSLTALVSGTASPHNFEWSANPGNLGTLAVIQPGGAVFTPAAGILKEQVVTIQACMAGVCGTTPLILVPFVRVASVTTPWNSGENNAIQIKGTGFGAHPQVSFSDTAIFFTPDALQTDPDTLITGTATTPILNLPESVVVTVTNTASPAIPPPGQFTIRINPVVVTVTLSPNNATVPVGQSATFNPTVTCKTAGNQPCPIPISQTVICTLKPQVGNVTSGAACVYTATSVSSLQVVQVIACSTVTPTACGPTCIAPTCGIAQVNVLPVNVSVSPKNITLFGGQKRQFTATVTNNPDTRVTWSIIPDPAVPPGTPAGFIDQNGYTAPNPIPVQENIKIRATSVADPSRFDDAPVTLVPLIVSPGSVVRKASQTQAFTATVSGTPITVDWSMDPNVPAAGSITPQGFYTAPAVLSTVIKATIIATSKADGSKGTATVFIAAACYPRCRAVSHGTPAVVGQPYSGSVRDPDTDVPQGFLYSGNLPPNLTFATDTGAISGIPVQPPAVYGFSATPFFADGDGGTQLYAFPVCQSVSAPPLTAGPFAVNSAYFIAYVPGTNPSGMFSYSATGALPPGMALDGSTGVVAGIPSAEGTYTYTIHTSLLPGVSAVFPTCPAGTSTDVTYQVTTSCDASCRIASLSPSSLTFAAQNAGTTSPAQTITLSNSGSGRMLVNNITTSGDFIVQTSSCGISLAAGASCVINVAFAPTAAGTRTGTLTVNDNAGGSPHTASLSGTGLMPTVSFSSGSLAFPAQMLGTTSAGQSVTLTNSGTGTLSISSITATGDFAQTNSCGNALGAGTSCIINITFTPSAAGLRTATLNVNDNAPGSPHVVSLSGAVLQGYHDVGNCQGMAGWAWDSTQPNTPITVYIFDGNRYLGSAYANEYRPDLAGAYGAGYHGFTWTDDVSILDGTPHSISVRVAPFASSPILNNSPRTITCNPSVSLAWIQPSAQSWGPANTLTAAGFATGGVGNVALRWRDATVNGSWNSVPYEAPPNSWNGGWSNTIPSADNCHAFQATVTYSGMTASKDYDGVALGYCSFKVIWIQPQSLAGFGPPGSLVVAGSAQGGPPNAQVTLWFRDDTVGSWWAPLSFAPIPDATGIWYNAIPNVDYTHQYSVYITYDDRNSGGCSYFGNGAATNCP